MFATGRIQLCRPSFLFGFAGTSHCSSALHAGVCTFMPSNRAVSSMMAGEAFAATGPRRLRCHPGELQWQHSAAHCVPLHLVVPQWMEAQHLITAACHRAGNTHLLPAATDVCKTPDSGGSLHHSKEEPCRFSATADFDGSSGSGPLPWR